MTDSIRVYVRKGSEKNERVISFIPPAEFTHNELLEDGWAIDGNQALRSILVGQLHSVEMEMQQTFRQKGFITLFC